MTGGGCSGAPQPRAAPPSPWFLSAVLDPLSAVLDPLPTHLRYVAQGHARRPILARIALVACSAKEREGKIFRQRKEWNQGVGRCIAPVPAEHRSDAVKHRGQAADSAAELKPTSCQHQLRSSSYRSACPAHRHRRRLCATQTAAPAGRGAKQRAIKLAACTVALSLLARRSAGTRRQGSATCTASADKHAAAATKSCTHLQSAN